MDAVLSAGKSEGDQITLFNPSQDGHFTHTAVSGNGSGGEILRVEIFRFYLQAMPPSHQQCDVVTAGVVTD